MIDRVREAGGNPWAAIRALLEANERLEDALRDREWENARLRLLISPGYARLPPT